MKLFDNFTYQQPVKQALDYSEAEKAHFKEMFAPAARRYRRCHLVSTGALSAWIIVFAIGLMRQLDGIWLTWLFGFCMAVFLGRWLSAGNLRCPACGLEAEAAVKTFCPECGAKTGNPVSPCVSCGRLLRTSCKGRRQYTIHCCTHCGVLLDDEGI